MISRDSHSISSFLTQYTLVIGLLFLSILVLILSAPPLFAQVQTDDTEDESTQETSCPTVQNITTDPKRPFVSNDPFTTHVTIGTDELDIGVETFIRINGNDYPSLNGNPTCSSGQEVEWTNQNNTRYTFSCYLPRGIYQGDTTELVIIPSEGCPETVHTIELGTRGEQERNASSSEGNESDDLLGTLEAIMRSLFDEEEYEGAPISNESSSSSGTPVRTGNGEISQNSKEFADCFVQQATPTNADKYTLHLPYIIEEAKEQGASVNQTAYILATAAHETGHFRTLEEDSRGVGYQYGIPNSRTGEVYYGRGYVQLTWYDNYKQFEDKLDLPLTTEPDIIVTDYGVAANILVYGMMNGSFTGASLPNYVNDTATDYWNARKVVNGTDKAEGIKQIAEQYQTALQVCYEDPRGDSATVPFWERIVAKMD